MTTLVAALACDRAPAARSATSEDTARGTAPPANAFDPAAVQRGDTIAGLVLERLEHQRTPSGTWVGSAQFAGTLELSGRTFRHPDGADYPFPCFEVDSTSARRLPRWSGDERRPWFCFENAEEAKAKLGGIVPGRAATIRVDHFTINRNLSDAVNAARLIDVVDLGQQLGSSEARCFVSSESVLARKPGSVVPGPAGLTGWVRLDGPTRADSGAARLVDADGRGLGASWRRTSEDSLMIVGFDDFLRVEMRVVASDSNLTGRALARSDAALERDARGRLVEFRREWNVSGRRARCDSVPITRGS